MIFKWKIDEIKSKNFKIFRPAAECGSKPISEMSYSPFNDEKHRIKLYIFGLPGLYDTKPTSEKSGSPLKYY